MHRVCLEANRYLDKYDAMAKEVNKLLGRIAPPAPVLPHEWRLSNAQAFIERYSPPSVEEAALFAWNACRAAMLYGAVPASKAYKLPQTQFKQVADLYEMQFDDGRTCTFHTDAQKAVQWLQACDGNRVQEYVKLERLQNALSGNSPVTPDGWISCSERMPDDGQHVIILCDGAFVLYAQYRDGEFFDIVRNGEEFFETQSRNVTHWMPLPEPPQE
ncbi:DUF551 domain-containing protein, partial [Escherichia coli]|uniref:DUF551 domain-containing protein n=1 Tax=Escherichia coli TaxID=562 RepID=UPI00201D27A1